LWEQAGWQRIALAVTVIVLGMYFRQLYGDLQIRSRIMLLQHLVLVMGLTFILEALFSYLNRNWSLPRSVLIFGSSLALTVLYLWRLMFSLAIRHKVGLRRVLFMGLSPASVQLVQYLARHPEIGFAPIGYLDSGAAPAEVNIARLDTSRGLHSAVEEYRPDWIVVGKRGEVGVKQADDFAELHFGGVQTEDAAAFYEKTLGRVCAAQVRPETLLFSEAMQPNRVHLRLQSFYSGALVLAASPVLLLLTGITALSARLTSNGPVLVREQRVGMHGLPFAMYWFRLDRDSLLRRLGMHALPQIWNVVRGRMSLVGPEADRPDFAAQLNQVLPFYAQRTAVRPGMTGWAQIRQLKDNSRGDALRRLEYDMYYIKNLSFLLDLFVLLRWFRETFLFSDSAEN
jgi:lipopolysaccharide/colanic/teichoic acid biosynthesis glycosyltransferase